MGWIRVYETGSSRSFRRVTATLTNEEPILRSMFNSTEIVALVRTLDVTAGEQAELEVFQHVSLCHIKYLLKPLKFVKVFFLGRSLFSDLTIRRFGRSFF